MKNLALKFVFITTLLGVSLASILINEPVLAQYYSQEEGNPKIVVDKQIRPITDANFYDNIGADQKLFVEGDTIEFKIKVENVGNQTLNNVKLTDLLPKHLSLLFYPGIYNVSSNAIENDIGSLDPGQSKEYYIRARIVDVPTSEVACTNIQINKVNAVSDQASDSDEAKYVLACKNVPTTGSNDIAAKTIIVAGVTFIGIGLRKLSRGY